MNFVMEPVRSGVNGHGHHRTGFLGRNNQLRNLAISPVYVVTKAMQLSLCVEDAILGTVFNLNVAEFAAVQVTVNV
jgi:hypothetical protein